MKKGLLSLLVVALTVVGCQDYDDQFDSLNKEILALKTDLTTIKGLSASITAISSEIKALEGKMVSDTDITGILTQIAGVKTAIGAIPVPVDNSTEIGGITTQVAGLNDEIATILEQLTKIQAASGGTYAGNLKITNAVQLTAAEDIVDASADGPKMTITGNVEIDADNIGTKEAANLLRIQAILDKIKVVSGHVSLVGIDAAMSASELLYVTGNLEVEGSSSMGMPKLNTVDGTVDLNLYGVLSYPLLGTAGLGLTLSGAVASITTVDLSGLTTGVVITEQSSLTLTHATVVKVGSLPASVTLANAITVEAHGVGNIGSMSISAPKATAVTIKAAKLTGTVTVSANLAAIAMDASEAGGLTVIHGASVDISKMTKTAPGATLTISTTATGLTATAFKTGNATITLIGLTTAVFPSLESLTATLTGASLTSFSAPKLTTSTNGGIDVKTTADGGGAITVKSIASIDQIVDKATISSLTVGGQANDLVFDTFVKLASLDYTGTAILGTLTISSTMVSMTTLTLQQTSKLTTLTVSGSVMTEMNTAGVILNTVIANNAKLATLGFGHTHLDGQLGTTVAITNNDKLVTLNMSSLGKVKSVSLTGNASLTSITAPSTANKVTAGVGVALTVTGNDITGTYSGTVNATETTNEVPWVATSAVITNLKAFIDGYSTTSSVTYSLDIDRVDSDGDGAFDDAGNGGAAFSAKTNRPVGQTGTISATIQLAKF